MKNEPNNDIQKFVIYIGELPFVIVTKKLIKEEPAKAPFDRNIQISAS